MDEEVRVLHVDDEPDLADLAATFLEREDERLSVETATSADEGRERLATDEFDCVVSDYDMPGRNGIEFLRAVREEHPDLPFILYTGKGSEEVASDAISAGATDYLQKESGTQQYELLANRIRNAVGQYRSERAQQRLLELAENTDRLLYIFTRDWSELLFISSAYEDIWGRSIDALRDDPTDFLAGVHPEDRAEVRDAMEAVSGGEPVEIECRVNAGEQYRRWVRIRAEPIFDESGAVARVAGFGADVTGEKRRRERRERQRETLVDLATDEAVTTGDFETAIRRITETAAAVLDVPRVNVWLADDGEEVLTCVDNYDRTTGDHTSGLELVTDDYPAYFEALETNRAIAVENAREDPRTEELADGYLDVHDVGALLDGTLRSEGETIGVICHEHVGDTRRWTDDEVEFASDVADIVHRALRNRERREREAELERTNALLSTLFETLPVGVLVEDESRDVLAANERLFDLFEMPGTPAEFVGADCERMAEEVSDTFADPAGFVERIEELVAERESVHEEELTLRDGRTFLRSHEPIELSDGGGHLWVYRDVTDQKEYERRLEQQNDRLEEFASVVSHDLRNPLDVAESGIELAREECDSEHLDTAERAHDRMNGLIDDLLALAREGDEVSEPEPVDLAELVETCWRTVDTAGARIVTDVDRTVRADRSRFRQLLENLLRNAVEHGNADVTVTVGGLDDGFYVADDGPGIPAGERDDIFDAGYSTAEGGGGFGLSIVEQVVEAHDWQIRVTEGSDGGARFEITDVKFVH